MLNRVVDGLCLSKLWRAPRQRRLSHSGRARKVTSRTPCRGRPHAGPTSAAVFSGHTERQRGPLNVRGDRRDGAVEAETYVNLDDIATGDGRVQLGQGQDAGVDRLISEPVRREGHRDHIPRDVEVAGVRYSDQVIMSFERVAGECLRVITVRRLAIERAGGER